MKLTLPQKTIILVSIPLVFEFVFVAVLGILLTQVDTESSNAFRAARIGNCSNKLIRDVLEFASIGHGETLESLFSDRYNSIVSTVSSDLNDLQVSVESNSPQEAIVNQSIEAGRKALGLLQQIRATYASGDIYEAMDELKKLQGQLRIFLKQTISHDLIQLAETEKTKAEQGYEKQSIFRKQITLLLTMGLVVNLALTIFVAFLVSKKIVGKLAILIDNNFRLAEGFPLHPLIGGTDEIANLDATFHDMANSIAAAKQKEQSMIEHSADIICSLDPIGRLTAINPACRHILGYSEDMILGMNLRSLFAEEDINGLNQSLSAATLEQEETQYESRVRKRDGNLIDLLWSIHWVPSEKSFFCVSHDITQRKELERMKQQFIAMVSHDLRTPLTTIGTYLELLSTGVLGELSEKGRHLLQIAERNANRMLSLINDLLDLEKAGFGGLHLDCSSEKLDELIDQSIKSLASVALAKKVKIETNLTELMVLADNKRILQVLVNLLGNAIKFSPEGTTINIETKKVDTMATVRISDQGRGVPEHLKTAVFERFQQVKPSDQFDQGGSGLGLAICKVFVELHGGTIQVENNSPAGSTFSFTLPLAEKSERQAA